MVANPFGGWLKDLRSVSSKLNISQKYAIPSPGFCQWLAWATTWLGRNFSSHWDRIKRLWMASIVSSVKWSKDWKCCDNWMKRFAMLHIVHIKIYASRTLSSWKTHSRIRAASANRVGHHHRQPNACKGDALLPTKTSTTPAAKPKPKSMKCSPTERQRPGQRFWKLSAICLMRTSHHRKTCCSCANWIRWRPTTIWKSFSVVLAKWKAVKWFAIEHRAIRCSTHSLNSKTANRVRRPISKWTMC